MDQERTLLWGWKFLFLLLFNPLYTFADHHAFFDTATPQIVRTRVKTLEQKAMRAWNLTGFVLDQSSNRRVSHLTQGQRGTINQLWRDVMGREPAQGRDHEPGEYILVNALLIRAMDGVLDQIQSPESRRLHNDRMAFRRRFQQITLRSELNDRQIRPSGMEAVEEFTQRIDASLHGLVRSRVIQGGNHLGPVIELLEIAAAKVRMAAIYLMVTHGYAVSQFSHEQERRVPQAQRVFDHPRMAIHNYLISMRRLGMALEVAQKLFPQLPEFTMDVFRREVRPGVWQIRSNVANGFIRSFAPYIITRDGDRFQGGNVEGRVQGLSPNHGQRIRRAMLLIEQSIRMMEQYRRNAFPFLEEREQRQTVMASLAHAPGFGECSALISGNERGGVGVGVVRSDLLDGQPCQPRLFYQKLSQFIEYYGQNPGYGLREMIMQHVIREVREADRLDRDPRVAPIKQAVDNEVTGVNLGSAFENRLRRRWPEVSRAIFNDAAFERNLGNGILTRLYLDRKLAQFGMRPMLGHAAEMNHTVEFAEKLKEQYERHNYHQIEQIVRLNATSSCKMFFDNDRANAPKILNTRKIVPILAHDPGRPVRWTTSRPSTAGYHQVLWNHEVDVANAVSIQATQSVQRLLAGVVRWTVTSRLLASAVMTQELISYRANRGNTPRDLGVTMNTTRMDRDANRRYALPVQVTGTGNNRQTQITWEPFIAEHRATHRNILEQFRRTARIRPTASAAQVSEAFRTRYRDEMYEAAQLMKDYQQQVDRVSNPRLAAADAADNLCKLFHLPPEHCPRDLATEVNRSLIETTFPTIASNYYRRTRPRRPRESPFEFRQRIARTVQSRELTPEDLLNEIVGWSRINERGVREQIISRNPSVAGRQIARAREYKMLLGGHDGYWAFIEDVTFLYRLYDHARAAYARRKAFLEKAVKMVTYLFPALQLDVELDGRTDKAFKRYRKTDAHFRAVMQAYLDNIVEQLNKVQEYDDDEVEDVLEEYMPNLPLVDQILTYFPDLKKAICEYQRDVEYWRSVKDNTKTGILIAASFASRTHPVATAISVGVTGIVVVWDVLDAIEAARIAREARKVQLASWTQQGFARQLTNEDLLAAVDMVADAAALHATVSVALSVASMAGPVIRNWKYIRGFYKYVPRHYIRGIRAANPELARIPLAPRNEGFFRYMSRLGPRLWNILRGRNVGMQLARILRPLRVWGVAEKQLHKTLVQRWSLARASSASWREGGRAARFFRWVHYPRHVCGWLKDKVLHIGIWRLQLGDGLVGRTIQFIWLKQLAFMMKDFIVDQVFQAPLDMAEDRVLTMMHEYGDLWNMVLEGKINRSEMASIVQADDEMRGPYDNRLREILRPLNVNAERVQPGMQPVGTVQERRTVLSRLQALHREVVAERTRIRGLPCDEEFNQPLFSIERLEFRLRTMIDALSQGLPLQNRNE